MTLLELEQKRPYTITVQDAAAIMDVTPRFLQLALQQGRFPFGTGVEMERWAFYINTERFLLYMKGSDIGGEKPA
ncbi:MAG: hypothetical protein WC365_00785 [Candidatus Babeliales bacterium]|jgi:hypothetical protein